MEREPIAEYFRLALKEILGPTPQRGAQLRVAEAAGISASYLNDVLKGRSDGSEDVRRAIARAVGKSYEKMIDRGREMSESYENIENTVAANEAMTNDIQWILTGKKPRKREDEKGVLKTELLRKTILEVEQGLSSKGMNLDPAKKARLVAILYESSFNSGQSVNKKIVAAYLDLLK